MNERIVGQPIAKEKERLVCWAMQSKVGLYYVP